jgi:large subunit ribosomal protein L25
MKSVSLTAYPRVLTRRGGAKKLRSQGRAPAVIYGRLIQPQNLEVKIDDLQAAIHGSASENVLVDLSIEGDAKPKRLALVQQIQHHSLHATVLHVDFHEVAEDEKVTIMVPVESVGEAEGVKTGGGVLEHVLFRLKVRGLPKDLPEVIKVDVSQLEIGQAVHIGDIQPPEGVQILGDKHISVLAVAAPLTEAQEAEAEAAAVGTPVEPEMIREKKEGEEAPAEAAGAKAAEKKPDKAEKSEKPEKAAKPEKAEKKK